MTPNFKILVSGKDISTDVSRLLMRMEWSDTVTEEADGFALTLSDTDGAVDIPKAGVKVELSAGYDGALQAVGSFTIDETTLEGPPDRLTVKASSAPFVDKEGKSACARKTKTWENTTLGSVAGTVASSLGMSPAVDSALSSVAVTNEQQTDESDTNFLLKLARRHGAYLKFAQGKMVLAKEGSGIGTSGAKINTTITKAEVTEWKISAGGKAQAIKRVKMKHHDFETGTTKEVIAEVPQSGSVGTFGVSQADTGVSTLVDFSGPNPYSNAADATAAAKTTAARIARATRKLELRLPGRLDIIAGGKVTLQDFRLGVAGEWIVKKITHRIDSGGWTMTVEGEGS